MCWHIIWICLLTFVGNAVVGAVFSYIRWNRYVDSECDYYAAERQRFLDYHAIKGSEIPDHLKYEWRNMVAVHPRLGDIPPKYGEHKGEIAFDVLFWWVSLVVLAVMTGYEMSGVWLIRLFARTTDAKAQKINKDLKG